MGMDTHEKPYQFGLLEYVKQAKQETIEITEQFVRAFYALNEEEKLTVIGLLDWSWKRYQKEVNYEYGAKEGIRMKRIQSFVEQWVKGQTEEWVTMMMIKVQSDMALTKPNPWYGDTQVGKEEERRL